MRLINRLVRISDLLRQRLLRKSLGPESDRERGLADEFRNKIRQLTIEIDPAMSPPEIAWRRNMVRLKELALQADPRGFLSWDVVSGTMFVRYAKYSRGEYRYLRNRPDWPRWKSAIAEDRAGNPPACPFDTTTSCNLVHHAYHVARFEEAMGVRVNNYDFVLEFGGGYGSMCRLLYRLDFAGQYLIVDLPAFSMLQEYFLKSVGIAVLTEEEFLAGKPGVLCLSDLESLKRLTERKTKCLMIATWSLSESPLSVREKVMDTVSSFDAYLIAFQPKFEGVDNIRYFEEWRSPKHGYQWKLQEIENPPRQHYLFGKSQTGR